MNICMVMREYPPYLNGTSVHTCELIDELMALGHEVSIVCPAQPSYPRFNALFDARIRSGIAQDHVHRVDAPRRNGLGKIALEILDLHREHRFDLVHIHFIYPFAVVASILRMLSNIRLVMTAHGGDLLALTNTKRAELAVLEPIRQSQNRAVLRGIRSADRLIVVSEYFKTISVSRLGLDPDRVTYVPNGVNLSRFSPTVNDTLLVNQLGLGGGPVVLYNGRLSPEKGIKYLIDAIPNVISQRPDIKFLIVGDGVLQRDCQLSVQERGCAKNVVFTGVVPYTEIAKYYAAADLVVVPSINEGSPLVVLEAIAMCRPVIVTRIPGVRDIALEADSLVPVKPRDVDGLARKILESLNRIDDLKRSAISSRRIAERRSWRAVTLQTISVYKSILS